jgi:hypothetical protein
VNARIALISAAIVIALSGVWATWFWLALPGRMPTDDDYRQSNEYIEKNLLSGDVIVLAPAWAERGRAFLTAAPVFAGYDLATDVYPGTKRQWLVALADVPRFSLEEARSILKARATSTGAGLRIGALWIESFTIAGPQVDFAFADALRTATVSIAGPKGETCRNMENGRHQCSHADWNYVAAGWHEVDEKPLHCIWAHPVDEGPLEIRFPDVPLHGALRGRAAFTDEAPAFAHGAPVELAVRLGDMPLGKVTITNRPGIQPIELQIPADAPATGDVTFSVSTTNTGMRHFCFDAWLGPAIEGH